MFSGLEKKAFTLIEIIVVIIIIAVLSTLLIPVYFNLIEKSNDTSCATNQRVLLGALEMYAIDNPQLPATLSQLRDKDLERAWAKEMSEPGNWKKRLAYAISDFNFKPLAYAASSGSWLKEYLGLVGGPACPKDQTPPPLGFSYGLSFQFIEAPSSDFLNANLDDLVIADSDDSVFFRPEPRHKGRSIFGSSNYAISITRGGRIVYYPIKDGEGDLGAAGDMGGDKNRSSVAKHECKVKNCKHYWQVNPAEWESCVKECELDDGGDDGSTDPGNGNDGDEGCFIATAAYGTVMAKEVQLLSEFRDKYLLNNSLGKGLTELYYRISPPAADYIRTRPQLKRIVRVMLKPVVWLVELKK